MPRQGAYTQLTPTQVVRIVDLVKFLVACEVPTERAKCASTIKLILANRKGRKSIKPKVTRKDLESALSPWKVD